MKDSTLIKQSPFTLTLPWTRKKKYPALAQLQSLLIEELSGKGDLCKFWSQLVSITTYLTYLNLCFPSRKKELITQPIPRDCCTA